MGDFNAKVGKGESHDTVGEYDLGERNQRGDLLVQFCQEERLAISNTWYKLPPRRLYTWKSPQDSSGHIVRNQIDFILVEKRYRNGILSVKTYPGTDIGSDHNPIIANLRFRLKKKVRKKVPRLNTQIIKNTETKIRISQCLNNKLDKIRENINQREREEEGGIDNL